MKIIKKTKKTDITQNQIQLLQGYYKFLYIGKFLEQIAKNSDLSPFVVDTPVKTGENTRFILKGNFIKNILSSIHKNPNQKNVFGYITEISAIRGVVSITKELLDNNEQYTTFIQKRMKKQYFPFEQIVRFIRNILNHTIDPNISLKESDFAGQKWFLNDQDKDTIFFKFFYSDFFPEWTGNKEYGINIKVNFSKLGKGEPLLKIINLHELYLICELCYNLSEVFKIEILHNKDNITTKIENKKEEYSNKPKKNLANTNQKTIITSNKNGFHKRIKKPK